MGQLNVAIDARLASECLWMVPSAGECQEQGVKVELSFGRLLQSSTFYLELNTVTIALQTLADFSLDGCCWFVEEAK
jgi:hypothetical protein